MKQTPAQHQRELDEHGEMELRAEREQAGCKELLLAGERYTYPAKSAHNNRIVETYVDEDDVLNAMFDHHVDEMKLALSRLESAPLEAARILNESKGHAVEHIVTNMIDFEEVATLCREIERQEAA